MVTRRTFHFGSAACALSAVMALPRLARAQVVWPERPVRLLVGFPPGGTVDIMARSIAEPLGRSLGQTVVVDNRPGASGNLALAELVKGKGDAHTFLVSSSSVQTANPFLFKSMGDPLQTCTAINSVGRAAMYVVARPGLRANDLGALIGLSKGGQALSYGSAGTGTQLHLAGEILLQLADMRATHVSYKGAAPALQDVLADQLDFVIDPGIAIPHIRSGKAKLLGVISAKRSPYFPEIRTLTEQGVPGAELDLWFGMWAAKDTPQGAIARLNWELAQALALPAVQERFKVIGAEPIAVGEQAFKGVLAAERTLFSRVIRERMIVVE